MRGWIKDCISGCLIWQVKGHLKSLVRHWMRRWVRVLVRVLSPVSSYEKGSGRTEIIILKIIKISNDIV